MKKNGFTLVELLIVISIISILSTIGAVVYTSVVKNSRDQQRLKDLQTIKQALELYRSDISYYPAEGDFILKTALSLVSPSDATKVYLDPLPGDPVSSQNYVYLAFDSSGARCSTSGLKCTKFTLCAKKEGSGVLSDSSNICSTTTPTTSCGTSLVCNSGLSSD